MENIKEDIFRLGLSEKEVAQARSEGKVNFVKEKSSKGYLEIIAENLFTFFNLVWALVALILILTGSFTNLTFAFVVIPNILIAVIQQIRAKMTVEKLSVSNEPFAEVIREGKLVKIKASEIVLGDVIRLESGMQVQADSVVVGGYAELNESMLTGESNAIEKREGDSLLAGSFLVSGAVFAKTVRVGKDNYVHKLESAAKGFKAPASNLFRDLNRMIKYIGIFLVPTTAAMAITNYYDTGFDFVETVEKTSGSVIGMIPAGIYLLITVTLTLSVIKLAKRRTLVQDMYSIEMLASADVLCLDKTGTITDGTMDVSFVCSLDGTDDSEIAKMVALIQGAGQSMNATSRALVNYFGKEDGVISDSIPFSSERKYSAVCVEGVGCFAIGAAGFVPCDISDRVNEMINERASLGERVLVLAKLDSLHSRGNAVALIALTDKIRKNANETIQNFQNRGVTVKIISGDNAKTVSSIAQRVGVIGAENYISCESLSDEELSLAAEKYAVFGRVTPEQKVLLIKALKSAGHTVAMTGDGVNDTLALKESNCAIAMAEGSDVAKGVSEIVLLDSDFSSLPSVVREGRRCINNVKSSASLFLMKTFFVIGLSMFAIFAPRVTYPFEPKQFMLLELFVIGISSVLLALEPNDERIKGSFLKTVMIKSIPSALVMYLPVLLILILGSVGVGVSAECRNSVAMIVVTAVGYINLLSLCRPFTRFRAWVCLLVGAGIITISPLSVFAGSLISPSSPDLLGFLPAFENVPFLIGMLGIGISLSLLLELFRKNIENLVNSLAERCKFFAKNVKSK